MTRAKDELVLTSAADYGSGAPAQGLALRGGGARPAVARAAAAQEPAAGGAGAPPAAPPEPAPGAARCPPQRDRSRLSFRQIDDYRTCPLKYHYVHVLRVPLLTHHRVVYGSAVHKAVQRTSRRGWKAGAFSEDDAGGRVPRGLGVGGLPLARARGAAAARGRGDAAPLPPRRRRERPWRPTGGRAGVRVLPWATRRWWAATTSWSSERGPRHHPRLQDRRRGRPEEGAASARGRACSSTSTRWPTCARTGRLPDRVELRFLESGLSGGQGADAPRTPRARKRPSARSSAADPARASSRPGRPTWPAASARSATSAPTPPALPKTEPRFPRRPEVAENHAMGLEAKCEARVLGRWQQGLGAAGGEGDRLPRRRRACGADRWTC